MDMFSSFLKNLSFPLFLLTSQDSQFYAPTYIGAALTAVVLYLIVKRRSRLSLKGVLQIILPRRTVRHASSLLDLKLFFFGAYYILLQVLLVGGLTYFTVPGTVAALNAMFGSPQQPIAQAI